MAATSPAALIRAVESYDGDKYSFEELLERLEASINSVDEVY
jgi:hypothetical protein